MNNIKKDAPYESYLADYYVQPNLFRLTRLFRINQALRSFEFAKGLRKLFFTLKISVSASFNIGILLILVMFMYEFDSIRNFNLSL